MGFVSKMISRRSLSERLLSKAAERRCTPRRCAKFVGDRFPFSLPKARRPHRATTDHSSPIADHLGIRDSGEDAALAEALVLEYPVA